MMKVFYGSTVRRSELVAILVEDLDFYTPNNFTHIIRRGKGGK